MLNGTLKVRFFIDISLRCLKTFIALLIFNCIPNFCFAPKRLTKISSFDQNLYFWPKFVLLTKIFTFDQNFYFWPKFLLLTKIFTFVQNFYFWPKFLLLTKIFTFDQNFYFCPKFLLLTKIFTFVQNFYFWPKFLLLTTIFTFDQNFYFCTKFLLLTKILILWELKSYPSCPRVRNNSIGVVITVWHVPATSAAENCPHIGVIPFLSDRRIRRKSFVLSLIAFSGPVPRITGKSPW